MQGIFEKLNESAPNFTTPADTHERNTSPLSNEYY